MTKAELRKLYKQKRQQLHGRDKLRMDDLLLIQFQQLYFEHVTTVLTYWPSDTHIEPNTHLFSGYLRHAIPNLQIAYPVITPGTNEFKAVLIDEDTVYAANSLGITEPKAGVVIEPFEIDLVLTPLLVCDMEGYRVGFGKGFYDRYFETCREDVIKLGFNYFNPVDKIDDTQPFDVPLNYCVTTDNIYEF